MEGSQALLTQQSVAQSADYRRPLKLLLAGSGSGGHMIPGLRIAESLREQGYLLECLFCTEDRTPLRQLLLPQLHPEDRIQWDPMTSMVGIAGRTLRHRLFAEPSIDFEPDIVIGLGGRAMLPWLAYAQKHSIQSLVFESNATAGKAVRWAKLFSDHLATQWEEPQGLAYPHRRQTGMPVTKQLVDQLQATTPIEDRRVILVTAGSQGAVQLSRMAARGLCINDELMGGWTVYHQAPERECLAIKSLYDLHQIRSVVQPQFSAIHELLPQAGLAISRGGACTLHELAMAGVPTIVCPMPDSPHFHQQQNARWYTERFAMRECDEQSTHAQESLDIEVAMLLESPELRIQLSQNCHQLMNEQPATGLTDWVQELLPETILGQAFAAQQNAPASHSSSAVRAAS